MWGYPLAREGQDREIASVDDVQSEGKRGQDESSKLGIHLGRAARDVNGADLRRSTEDGEEPIDGRRSHALGSVGPGVDVAVGARLVAMFPDVDLHGGGGLVAQCATDTVTEGVGFAHRRRGLPRKLERA